MIRYFNKFTNHAAYEAVKESLEKPNVSMCEQEEDVHYNAYVPKGITATFNVTNASTPTKIMYQSSITESYFTSILIDGVAQSTIESSYTLSVGEHTIFYVLRNDSEVGDGMFRDCTSMISVVTPDTVSSIGHSAFYGCSSLSSVTFEGNITSFGQSSFSCCESLQSFVIPTGVTSISQSLFENCTSLTSVTWHSGITTVNELAFYLCTSLPTIALSKVVTIKESAFNGCASLTSVTIGNTITSIGAIAFGSTNNPTRNIYVSAATPPSLGEWALGYTEGLTIHVGSARVTLYKQAWPDYASCIQA